MSLNIASRILSLPGQCVKQAQHDLLANTLTLYCGRDRRYSAYAPCSRLPCTINRYVKRVIRDLPLCGFDCHLEVELAQVVTANGQRLMEQSEVVDSGCRFTRRFCQFISGLCRHMSISKVAQHLNLRWETVKAIDKRYLSDTLAALDPGKLSSLTYIGVDEVARAKGHDYMTLIYDMESGHLIGVETGRTADVLIRFLSQLTTDTANGIKGVAMDMSPAYQKAVKQCLPNADMVFDRFHVMQNYSKALKNQRRIEFRKADKHGKALMKGTHYLLLKNADKLSDEQSKKLNAILDNNANLNLLYTLKEQLQQLWSATSFESMSQQLEDWCQLADATAMLYLKKFAKSLRKHAVGICNYAKHRITSARIEAGNVSIGMIRKRARGIKDTEYFKLKIRQTSCPETQSIFYNLPH